MRADISLWGVDTVLVRPSTQQTSGTISLCCDDDIDTVTLYAPLSRSGAPSKEDRDLFVGQFVAAIQKAFDTPGVTVRVRPKASAGGEDL
jgi:hypothetical protein